MSGNLEGTIPAEWMRADAHDQVIGFVRALAIPTRLKQQLFAKWAYTVHYAATPADFAFVLGRASTRGE